MKHNYITILITTLLACQSFLATAHPWTWILREGSTNSEFGRNIAADAAGNLIQVTACNGSTNFGSNTFTFGNRYGLIFNKRTNSGNLVWVKSISCSGDISSTKISISPAGDIFISGYYTDTLFTGTNQYISQGIYNSFVLKLNSSGDIVSERVSTNASELRVQSIAHDSQNNIYLCGYFDESISWLGNTYTATDSAKQFFVIKTDPSFNTLWFKQGGGTDDDYPRDIICDNNDNAVMVGVFYQNMVFGTSTLSGSLDDIVTIKFSPTGNILWAKTCGGSDYDYPSMLTCDANNNIYFSGGYIADFQFGAFNISGGNANDQIFLVKYDKSGNEKFLRTAGGSSYDNGNSLIYDNNGSILLVGEFNASATFGGSTTLVSLGSSDIFIAQYDTLGAFVAASRAGGNQNDMANQIVVDNIGNAFVTGSYFSTTPDFGPYNLNNLGGADMYTGQFCLTKEVTYVNLNDDVICTKFGGVSFEVPFYNTGCYHTGNVFTAYLSDENGVFGGSPVAIGSVTSTNVVDTITVTLPSSMPNGTGYKIKVESDDPNTYQTVSDSLTIFNYPDKSFIFVTDDTLFVNNNSSYTYQWFKDNTLIGGANSYFYKFSQNGFYYCIASNGYCETYSDTFDTNILTLSMETKKALSEIKTYPNPLDENTLFVENINAAAITAIELFDYSGRKLAVNFTKQNETLYIADCSTLANGMFHIRIISGEGITTKKLVVAK